MSIEKFESSIEEINEALVRIFYAKDRGYTFFDFKSGLEKMFHYYSDTEGSKKIIQNLYNVFNDLFKPKYLSFLEVEAVDDEKKEYILKAYKQNPNANPPEVSTIKHPINDLTYIAGDRFGQTHLSKYRFYLEGVAYKDGAEIKIDLLEWNIKDKYQQLFEKHGVSIFPEDNSMTFEKYVSWIDKEPMEVDSLIETANGEKKIKWNAGPAALGYLIDELERNGYIKLPFGTINKTNAEFLLKIFELKASATTLAIELSEKSNNLTPDVKARISIKPISKNKE